MELEQKFIAKLVQAAKLANVELGAEMIEIYDKTLSSYGYDKACNAIDLYMVKQRGRFNMPQIGDLLCLLTPTATPESQATDAAGRILEALHKHGSDSVGMERAKEFIGELGWKVVQREGGWAAMCASVTNDQLPILKAQWKKMALAQLERHDAGLDDQAPAITDKREPGFVTLGEIARRLLPDEYKKLQSEGPQASGGSGGPAETICPRS